MPTLPELIPELALWNNGKGIAPDTWAYIEGRADHALAFTSLFWPEFVEFEGYVLRAPLDEKRLRDWEGVDCTRQQVETAMNAYFLEGIFPDDPTAAYLKEAQCMHLASIMADMVSAKLVRDFPKRSFSVFVMEGDDFGISFHEVSSSDNF